MAKKFFIAALGGFIILFVFGRSALSQENLSNVSYPIFELGNCSSQENCRAFCDKPENYVACAKWAAKNGIMLEEEVTAVEKEVEQTEKFESGEIKEGPGGCKTPEECDAYCQKIEHSEECFKFGVEHNLISPEEAKQIQKQKEEMKGPGGCKTNDECDTYCSEPEHAEECINYAVKDGTLTQSEANELLQITAKERKMREARPPRPEEFRPEPKKPEVNEKKVKEILKSQKGPGGCSTVEECKGYCENLNHTEECLSFAEKNGLVSSDDLEQMKTMTKVMTTTGGPGGCKGPEECDKYCASPEHQEECLNFAKKHNLISPEEAKMMEKMAGGGPGGCKNQEECDAYCRQPSHMEECLMFSVKQGMMTKEDAQRMMEIMKTQEKRGLMLKGKPPTGETSPKMPHMFEGGMPKENEWPGPPQVPESGQMPVGPGFKPEPGQMPPPVGMPPEGEMPQKGMMPGVQMPPNGQMTTGPGGCKTHEECNAYCSKPEHQEECSKFQGEEFQPPENQQMPPGEQMAPPEGEQAPLPEEQPQSFFERIKDFLAGLAGFIK